MKTLLRLTIAALAGALPLALSAAESAPAGASPARRAEINTALERTDLPAAWRAARTWLDATPRDPAARLAEAELYLRFNAPAAAISSAGAGLAALTEKSRHLERPLLVLKAQAHAAIGEHAPAWAAFSRIVAQAGTADQGDPIVATARRARWDSYAQLSSGDDYARFIERISPSLTGEAPVAERIRYAQWLATSKSPAQALNHLRPLLLAQPQSVELRAAFADLYLCATDVSEGFSGIEDLERDNREALALLRTADPDPFGSLVIRLIQTARAPEPEFERRPPREPAKVAQTFLSSLPERRARMVARLSAAIQALAASQAMGQRLSSESAPADLAAWEKRLLADVIEIQTAQLDLSRLEDAGEYLEEVLQARTADPAGTAAEKQALVQLQKLVPQPEAQRKFLGDADTQLETVPRLALRVRQDRRIAEARARYTAARSPTEQLAATDSALAVGDKSSVMWRQRMSAALALGDRATALASGASTFVSEWLVEGAALDRELPAATAALLADLEKEVAGATILLASATAAWESGKPEAALAHLDHALQVDPALPAAWRLRWQWCEAGGDLAGAAFALERWWRLDDSTPYDRSTAFGIASRAGAWQLLLSLADARLALEPADTEAIFFRAHAAFACNRPAVARASLPLLDVSVQRDAATLLSVALACLDKSPPSYSASSLRGKPEEPPGLAELFACYERLNRGTAAVANAKPPAPGAKPSAAAIHLERLEGRIAPADYLSRTRGTPQEAMAEFVTFFLGSLEGMSPESRERASALSADARLPLAVRAYAHRMLVVDGTTRPAPALRASDLYYASAAPATAPWGAPGQEVFVEKDVNTSTIPADWPVRLRGPANASVTVTLLPSPGPKEATTRLWELRTVTASGDFYISAKTQRPVLLANDTSFTRSELKVAGAARLDGCDFSSVVLHVTTDAAVELCEPSGALNRTTIAGSLQVQGGELSFNQMANVAATGRVEIQGTKLAGALPFALAPGGKAAWRDVVAYSTSEWPAQLSAGWSIEGARIQALTKDRSRAIFPLPAPHKGTLYVLAPSNGSPTRRVTTILELQEALSRAQPGDIIELGTGDHQLGNALDLPPGVSIYAAAGARLSVSTATNGAFRIMRPGAVRIVGIISAVATQKTTYAGSTVQIDDSVPKTAITVGNDAWVMAEAGSYYGWHHRAHQLARVEAGGRLEFHRHEVNDKVFVDPKGELIVGNPRYDPAGKLLAAIRRRTRDEQWADARTRFDQAIARSTNRTDREKAARTLAEAMGETAQRTDAGQAESTRALMTAVVPILQRYPSESPQIFGSTYHYQLDHPETMRSMMPASLLPYFKAFSESFRQAQSIGLNKVSTDNIYGLILAYPPGSAHYAAARSAMERNLTPAQFEAELAAKAKKAAELAAALEKQRKETAARLAEEAKRPKPAYSATAPASSSGSSSWSSRTYTIPSSPPPPAWTPSESHKMQIYRHNLDVQISRAVRGY